MQHPVDLERLAICPHSFGSPLGRQFTPPPLTVCLPVISTRASCLANDAPRNPSWKGLRLGRSRSRRGTTLGRLTATAPMTSSCSIATRHRMQL